MNVTIVEMSYFYRRPAKKHIIYEDGTPLCRHKLGPEWDDMDGLDTDHDDLTHVCKICLRIIRKPNVVETPDGWEMK